MNAVQIVKVSSIQKLYKNSEEANAIELISLQDMGFNIVAQKGLYNIGDNAVYIQPDYNLPDTPLFESYIRPYGDEKKSRLGKNNRIRAVKFNLSTSIGSSEPVYSEGILIPLSELSSFLCIPQELLIEPKFDLTERLGVTKISSEPEENNGSLLAGGGTLPFPRFLYKTDETNIKNIKHKISFPLSLTGSKKYDGSSITLYYRNGDYGICSRNQEKSLTINKVVGRRKPKLWDRIKRFFGFKVDLNLREERLNDSDFVTIGKPYLDSLITYCMDMEEKGLKVNIALRGELILGNGRKGGSGNKNNPDFNSEAKVVFFGWDVMEGGMFKKGSQSDLDYIVSTIEEYGDIKFETAKTYFINRKFYSYEGLMDYCKEIFSNELIEGMVVRTADSKFSAKIMNPEYDSKK